MPASRRELPKPACSREKPKAAPISKAASIAAERAEAARADASRRLQELEAAVEDARQRIGRAEANPTLTRQQRLALSETRRAVVVANVSLQKARTAFAANDYAAASLATEGAADRLRAVAEGKSVTSAQPPASSRK